MVLDIYSLLIGVSVAIIFQFIALIYHVKVHNREPFMSWWLLGNSMIVLGILAGFIRQIPQLERYSLIALNSLVILGQGCYYIAVETYLNPKFKLDKLRIVLGSGFTLMIYFSIFSTNTILRMLSTSIVLFLFSALSAKRIYQNKIESTSRSSSFLIATFMINAVFWIFRAIFISLVLPKKPDLYNLILALSYISVLMLSTLGTLGVILLINQKLVYITEREHLKFLTIFETSPDFIIVTEFGSGNIELTNSAFLTELGYKKEEVIGKTTVELGIWEDNSFRDKFIEDINTNKKLSYYEGVFRKKDGSTFFGSLSVSILNLDKKDHIMSMIRDITPLKEAQALLQESEQKYKALAMSSASWEAWFDENGKLIWTNDLIEDLTGFTMDESILIDNFLGRLIITDDISNLDETFKTTLKNRTGGHAETRIHHKTEGCKWLLIYWRPIYDSDKAFKGFRTSIVDITERKRAESEIESLATQLKKEKETAEKISLTDGMTGLSNRRYLDDQIILEYFRMKRTGQLLSIIMLDVDFFKLYNDTYGHLQGDECLKNIAKVIKNSVKRATDITARYGGEEFVVLLPDTNDSGAATVAERIRQNVELLKMEHISSKIAPIVTVSIGIATFNKYSDISPEMMIQKADEALYNAKNTGRNRVIKNFNIVDKKEENFLRIVWSVNFESGHAKIDEQHKRLFDASNKIFETMFYLKSHDEQRTVILDIMTNLKDHFTYEENVLSEINYPEKAYHSASHERLMKDAEILIQKFDNNEIQAVEVLNFIIFDVIAEHLYKQDTLYFPYINVEKTSV